jgi:hypothetical protein
VKVLRSFGNMAVCASLGEIVAFSPRSARSQQSLQYGQ